MPNWKKVLLSGSKAAVYDITASNLPYEGSTDNDVVVLDTNGHLKIANREDVSNASGPLKAVQFAYSTDGGTTFKLSGSSNFTFEEDISTNAGEITSSLTLSGSGEAIFNLGREGGISKNDVLGVINFIGTGSNHMEGPSAVIRSKANNDFGATRRNGRLEFLVPIGNGPNDYESPQLTISESIVSSSVNVLVPNLHATNDITASGNISSSGYISASNAYFAGSSHISSSAGKSTLTLDRASGKASISSSDWFIADSKGGIKGAALNFYNDAKVILANGGGNVGIGTFNSEDPGEKLEVRGNISASGNITGVSASLDYVSVSDNIIGVSASLDYVSASGTIVGNDITSKNQFLAEAGGVDVPGYSFRGDPDTGIYQAAPSVLNFTTNGSARFSIGNSGTTVSSGYLRISQISEDTSNGYRPVVVNTSTGQLHYTASDAFGGGGGGGTLDEVTTSGNQTDNTIRVGELTSSLVDDPADINAAISGDWTNGTRQPQTTTLNTGAGTLNNFTFDFTNVPSIGSYTGPLYMEKLEVKGDFDDAGKYLYILTIGGYQFVQSAQHFTSNSTTFATVFSGSYSDDFGTLFSNASPPSNNYPGLDTANSNFTLNISNVNNTSLYGVTCNNGIVSGHCYPLGDVDFVNAPQIRATFRKPTVTYNPGSGLYSGVDSNIFAAQIKHLGSPSSGQDPNGLLITLGSSNSQNNAEFIRFTGIEGNLPSDGNITPGAVLSNSELGSIVNDGGVATLSPPSDKRLKKDIIPISSSLSNILNVDPVHYTWKSSNIKNIGFIAQDLYEHIPEAVIKGDKNTIWKLNYNNIIPHLVKAIQEQQAIIEDLKTKIDNLLK
jgi:hypothetical protein